MAYPLEPHNIHDDEDHENTANDSYLSAYGVSLFSKYAPMIAKELIPCLAILSLWSPSWAKSAADIAAAPVKVTDPETKVVLGSTSPSDDETLGAVVVSSFDVTMGSAVF